MESENCVSSPMIVLKDCNVLGRGAPSGKPNENRSHSAPNRSTPSLNRGVNTRRRFESISSKSLTSLPPCARHRLRQHTLRRRHTRPTEARTLLLSSAKAGVANKSGAPQNQKIRIAARTFSFVHRLPPLSRRKRVTALVIFFIITDSEPNRSTPWSDPSAADGDHVAAPDQRRRFSFDRNRPQLIKRERDIITAAGVVKDVRGLISSAGAAAVVRRARASLRPGHPRREVPSKVPACSEPAPRPIAVAPSSPENCRRIFSCSRNNPFTSSLARIDGPA